MVSRQPLLSLFILTWNTLMSLTYVHLKYTGSIIKRWWVPFLPLISFLVHILIIYEVVYYMIKAACLHQNALIQFIIL